MDLKDTIDLMTSDNHQDRFIAEYNQTKIRRDNLSAMLVKWDAGTLDFDPVCPKSLLMLQKRHMDEYLHDLEVRAELEQIPLT